MMTEDKIKVKLEIEKLLKYGREKGLLGKWDVVPARNKIMDLLNVEEPAATKYHQLDYQVPDSPQKILDKLLAYAAQEDILLENTVTYRDLLDAKIMGQLMPRQSEVAENFWQTAEKESITAATDNYYALAKHSNYIRQNRIARNLFWTVDTDYGELEITINLSKPEKDPAAIAAAKEQETSNYPQCYLCLENVGYSGRLDHPARQNHRVIPLDLEGEQWFLQYSPYVYYNEHCIVFHKQHRPMNINQETFAVLFDFINQFPHYFLGSNADLPRVGGSILDHDHFQGGNHTFPMEKADIETEFTHPEFPEVTIGMVDWPMSVIRLQAESTELLVNLGGLIHRTWAEYSDPERNILAVTNDEQHNTVTPIARKRDNQFELDLVLRNNRTTEQHPYGIFHPHQDLHHIKKENIGLIEVMGRAILPGRLKEELKEIKKYLTGKKRYNRSNLEENLTSHGDWIEKILADYGANLDKDKAQEILEREVGAKFTQVLTAAGVYKPNKSGEEGLKKFLSQVGIT